MPTARTGRLAVFYAVLAVIVAAVVIVVIEDGKDEKAQPSIAGGYDTSGPNACLGKAAPPTGAPLPPTAPTQPAPAGPAFDVKQSGQFVNFSNIQGTLGGKLRLHTESAPGGHLLTGTVDCVKGKDLEFRGHASPRPTGAITGTLGGAPVTAILKRDPPDPGATKPRVPDSVASLYKLSPRSTCFGGSMELHGKDNSYEVEANGKTLGSVSYNKSTGALAGDVACTRGGKVRFRAAAVDRNLNNVTLIPLDATAASIGNRRSSRRTSGRSTAAAAPPSTAGTARRIARENVIGPTLRSADPTAARRRQ